MQANDDKSHKVIESLARLGYTAKGVVYSLVGILAVLAAFGPGGQKTGTKGAISQLAGQAFGRVMLVMMALGLAGYVVWRFTQVIADSENKGNGPKGILGRAGLGISGLIYAGLAVYTIDILVSSGGGGGSTQSHMDRLMSHSGGIWAVAAIGLSLISVGVYQAWRAYRANYKKAWNTSEMSPGQEQWASGIARVGLVARAIVFILMGIFITAAALEADPSKARGSGGVLRTLSSQPYGPYLLAIVALGLVCYGIYCFVNARFRHINP